MAMSKHLSALSRKNASRREDGAQREEAERRRMKPRKFLQNAYESMESDFSVLVQTAMRGFYHAQRRRDRAQS